MKREEAYQTFKIKEVEPLVNQYLLDLEEKFQQNKDKYAEIIINQFKEALINLSELQQKKNIEEIGYLIVTALRTNLYQKNYTLTIKAYNTHLYLDNNQIDIGECDITPIIEGYSKLYEQLQKERKKYVGKLCATDIRNLLNPCIKGCIDYSIKLCKYIIPKVIETEEYKKIEKAERFYIYGEEYMDQKTPLYVEIKTKDLEEIKENIMTKEKKELICADYSNLDLSDLDFGGLNLSYSNFSNCIIKNANFEKAILNGCTFYKSKIQNTSFQSACLLEASFKKTKIKDTTFKNAIGYTGGMYIDKWEYIGNLPIDFTEAEMERVDFTESIIIDAKY